MKKNLFIIFFCGATMVFTSCVDTTDNPVTPPQEENKSFSELKEEMMALYGENKKITDGNYDKSLAVKCINGTFVGKRTGDVIAHKGIPFVGQQPVGELRWKAPVDVVPDDGVYEAYYNGKSPCQDEGVSQRASLYPQGEDCLYLNVWRAADGAVNKPVMVWIHGGAFEIGGTVEPREEGTNFVKENPDVILVSVEYRLNVFGFLHLSHLPDGADYPDAQNLGLMDQLMALKWVHENIAAFDGNPDNVTIFGESAGAGSVTLLPLVKGSQQYFKRVIAESGAPVFTRSTEEAIACTNELMAQLGCSTVADLQKVEVSKLVAVADGLLGLRTWAERDGNFLPLDPYEAYANGAAKDIDLMHGCNKDEMNYFVWGFGSDWNEWAADRKAKKMAQMTDEEKALVESFCNDIKGEPYEYTSRLFDQLVFIAPLFRLSENQTKAGGKTYNYFFTVESSVPLMKCGHAVELSTVFNHPEQTFVTGRTFNETFSKTMRRMWVQFAKTGNPSLSASESPDGKAKEWPLYDLENKQLMIFDEFDIHPEKESQRKIIDWDRTYFLTKYYCI
jgi:para-nitrobenzyl esterase